MSLILKVEAYAHNENEWMKQSFFNWKIYYIMMFN